MLHLFAKLKGLYKSKQICIDHMVFRLHYRFTVLILIVFCIVVTTKQYGGDPIKCAKNSKPFSTVADSYCLINAAFISKSAYNESMSGMILYPGVKRSTEEDDKRYLHYYQWVGFVLFIQAACFYFPHWLWKSFEGNKVEWIVSGIDEKFYLKEEIAPSKEEIAPRRDMIFDHLPKLWGHNNTYAMKYFFSEFLCFANAILQMYVLNKMFDGEFQTYGTEALQYMTSDSKSIINPMTRLFPRVGSCIFPHFGENGKVIQEHLICVLSVNVVNEKIFLFLWFWFVILSVVSIWVAVYRLATYVILPLRTIMIQTRYRYVSQDYMAALMRSGGFGDWFLLHLIEQNIDDAHFLNMVENLANKLTYVKNA